MTSTLENEFVVSTNEPLHFMTMDEREKLKNFARRGVNCEQTVIMISHWMRNKHVGFYDYTSNWVAAQTDDEISAMRQEWPLIGPRMIKDQGSDWNSYS